MFEFICNTVGAHILNVTSKMSLVKIMKVDNYFYNWYKTCFVFQGGGMSLKEERTSITMANTQKAREHFGYMVIL